MEPAQQPVAEEEEEEEVDLDDILSDVEDGSESTESEVNCYLPYNSLLLLAKKKTSYPHQCLLLLKFCSRSMRKP
jgi:hypothetical protein